MKNESLGYRVFNVCNNIFMAFVMLLTAYPMYYVLVASFSDPKALSRTSEILLRPLSPITFTAYEKIFSNPMIGIGYLNTVFVIVVGVSLNILMTSLGAYFLSLKGVRFGTGIMFFIVMTIPFRNAPRHQRG